MIGKGSQRRPPTYVPHCTSVRHVWLAGCRRCVCGQREHTPRPVQVVFHDVTFPNDSYEIKGSDGQWHPGALR